MVRHILPNVFSQIIVAATLAVGAAILPSRRCHSRTRIPLRYPELGRLLYDAKDFFQFYPHEALFPGLVIFLTVLSINYIGDGLRDALDPRKTR